MWLLRFLSFFVYSSKPSFRFRFDWPFWLFVDPNYLFTTSVSLVLWLKVTELPFFASKVRLGRCGIEEILPLGPLNEFERSVFHTRTYNYSGSCCELKVACSALFNGHFTHAFRRVIYLSKLVCSATFRLQQQVHLAHSSDPPWFGSARL